MKRKDRDIVSYIGLDVKLISCIKPDELLAVMHTIKEHLIDMLKPDYDSDVSVSLVESAGYIGPEYSI